MRYECFLMLTYLNYRTLLLNINFKGVFRTQSSIYGATFLLRKAPSWMFNWVWNTPLNFDLFYLFLVDTWEWLVCLAPWEKFFFSYLFSFPYIPNAIQAYSRFLVRQQISNWVKKDVQWFSNILMCKIHLSTLAKSSQIYYSIINLLGGHVQICLMRLIEHLCLRRDTY